MTVSYTAISIIIDNIIIAITEDTTECCSLDVSIKLQVPSSILCTMQATSSCIS